MIQRPQKGENSGYLYNLPNASKHFDIFSQHLEQQETRENKSRREGGLNSWCLSENRGHTALCMWVGYHAVVDSQSFHNPISWQLFASCIWCDWKTHAARAPSASLRLRRSFCSHTTTRFDWTNDVNASSTSAGTLLDFPSFILFCFVFFTQGFTQLVFLAVTVKWTSKYWNYSCFPFQTTL